MRKKGSRHWEENKAKVGAASFAVYGDPYDHQPVGAKIVRDSGYSIFYS